MIEVLEIMNSDIKNCEHFMQDYPITETISYDCGGDKRLIWNNDVKFIILHTGSISKRLLQWDIKNRTFGYEHLVNFMKFCIEKQSEIIDVQSIKLIHSKIIDFFGKN